MRLLSWTLWTLGTALWLGAAALFTAWAFGRIVTDRWAWSQYLFWIPSIFCIPASAAALPLAVALRAWARRLRIGTFAPGPREKKLAALGLAAVALAAGGVAIFEYRWLSPRPEPALRTFRAMHWNASDRLGTEWDLRIADQEPDLLVINPGSYQPWDRLLERTPHLGAPIWGPSFFILTRHRALRTGSTMLSIDPGAGIDPRDPEHLVRRTDHGRAMFLELDTRALLGRTLIVWCLDLPSDISLPRRRVTEQAAEAIAAFHGPVRVLGEDGVYAEQTPQARGFPPPDLILGDMNIPRGSLSLTRLAGNCTPAFDQAGSGPSATWPYENPVYHLDQMFIAPWLRAVDYRAVDLAGGTHRAQRADLAPRASGTLAP